MAYDYKTDPNWRYYNDPYAYAAGNVNLPMDIGAPILGTENLAPGRTAATSSAKGDKVRKMFDNAKNKASMFADNLMSKGKNTWTNVKSGKGIMPKYAGLAKAGMGAMAGIKAVKGISDYQNAQANTKDLVNDILASAAGNPNISYDLSADQLQILRQLQNGTYDTTGDFDMGSVLGNLGNIVTGAGLGFVTGGGPVGAILGGASGLVDGISSGMVDNQNQITADLQGLYQALYESEMANKAMKRDAYMQRYANSLY